MDARTLNKRVVIESQSTSKDALGQQLNTWSEFATVWANIAYLRGIESIKAGAATSIANVSIRIRYRTDITAGMRVSYSGTIFNITSVLPDAAKQNHVDLVCEVVK